MIFGNLLHGLVTKRLIYKLP